ncbi:hypothetical protein IAD21_04377 [Abditibacteriota bacterium]|nr:hypothetical protein IAD21_04377 [Abditibacteriota bacterium]
MAKPNRMWIKPVAVILAMVLGCWLLSSLFWRFLTVLTVNSIAFSPNGQLVAGAGGWLTPHDGNDLGGALWIWNARSGTIKQRLTARFSSMQVLRIVAFSEDGSTIAAWQGDGRKFLWDVESGRLLQVQEPAASLRAQAVIHWTQRAAESSTQLLPFVTSPSGNRLLAQSGIPQRRIMMSRVQRALANYPQEELRALSAQNLWMATYQQNEKVFKGTLRIRCLASSRASQVLPEELGESYPLKFSPDNKFLALSQHRTLHFWDLRQRRLRLTFNSQVVYPLSLAFSPDSRTIVESGGYGDVEMWDVTRGRRLHHWVVG